MASPAQSNDLSAPLLSAARFAHDGAPTPGHATFLLCTFNLVKAIIGAGMMAIPRAFFLTGWVLGTATLLMVALITFWTLTVLVDGSEKTGAPTYVGLTKQLAGRGMSFLLQLALFFFCFGFLVIYLVMMADLLVGTPPLCNGLLCELFGISEGLMLNRKLVLGIVCTLVCAPLMRFRSMAKLSFSNFVGVASIFLLALLCAWLGVTATASGTAQTLPPWPQWGAFGSSPAQQVLGIAAVVPVVLSCYVAHQNLHPVLPLLVPYSPARMKGVLAVALLLAAGVFLAMAVGTGLAFGGALDANVLNNLFVEGMEPILGKTAAIAATLVVRGAYLIALLASTLLYMFPLRTCISEILCSSSSASIGVEGAGPEESTEVGARGVYEGELDNSRSSTRGPGQGGGVVLDVSTNVAAECSPAAAAEAAGGDEGVTCSSRAMAVFEQKHFYALTYGLLAAAFLVAVAVPNIWSVLSLVGDCATTVEAFIVPGVLALAMLKPSKAASAAGAHGVRTMRSRVQQAMRAALACLVVFLGVGLFVNGILLRVLQH